MRYLNKPSGIDLALLGHKVCAAIPCGTKPELTAAEMQCVQPEYGQGNWLEMKHVASTIGHFSVWARSAALALWFMLVCGVTLMPSVASAGPDDDQDAPKAAYNETTFQADLTKALNIAELSCRNAGQREINPLHVYLALFHLSMTEPEGASANLFKQLNLNVGRSLESNDDLRKRILPEGRTPVAATEPIVYSAELKQVLAGAEREREARTVDGKQVRLSPAHFLLAGLHDKDSQTAKHLLSMDLNKSKVLLAGGIKELDTDVSQDPTQRSFIADYLFDMSKKARAGDYDPLIGRSEELRRVRVILNQRRQNSPLLVGGAGTGKTALVEELAKTHDVLEMKLAFLTAGSKLRGSLEDRIKGIVKELTEANEKAKRGEGRPKILFIDEVHLLGEEEYKQVAQHLKPALSRGEIPLVAATTLDEVKNVEKDDALNQRFQRVRINEPDRKMAYYILTKVIHSYEALYGVKYSNRAILAAVDLTNQYVYSENQPRKAIKAIDNAGSRAADARRTLETGELPPPLIKAQELVETLESWRGIAKDKLDDGIPGAQREFQETEKALQEARNTLEKVESLWHEGLAVYDELRAAQAGTHERSSDTSQEDLKRELTAKLRVINRQLPEFPLDVDDEDIQRSILEMVSMDLPGVLETPEEQLSKLSKRVQERFVGQREGARAIEDAAAALISGKSGQGRPAEVHLYIGAHGSGKSLAPDIIQEVALGRRELIKTFNLAGYTQSNAGNRLIGSPPGFEGGEGRLTEYVRRNPRAVISFKNIDKASPEVYSMIMQILASGELEDQKTGKVISFENTVILISTSEGHEFTLDEKLTAEERKNKILEKLQSGQILRKGDLTFQMSPDDLSLFDRVVYFDSLKFDELKEIFQREMKKLGDERRRNNRFDVTLTDKARAKFEEALKNIEGSVENARLVRQLIRSNIESNQGLIARENPNAAGNLVIDYDESTQQLHFRSPELQKQFTSGVVPVGNDPCAKSFSLLSAKFQSSKASQPADSRASVPQEAQASPAASKLWVPTQY
jgi:ATP-dependent Clp protease ATP-binding subunit ClpB